jgi:hypothetical protein
MSVDGRPEEVSTDSSGEKPLVLREMDDVIVAGLMPLLIVLRVIRTNSRPGPYASIRSGLTTHVEPETLPD